MMTCVVRVRRRRKMMMMNNNISNPNPMVELEMKVLSCEGLNNLLNYSCSSSNSTRPFISLTNNKQYHHTSRLNNINDDEATGEGALFRVPLDSSFFSDANSSLQLQLYTKRRIVGSSQLGWCVIPASDIIGLLPPASVRYLSYRLRGTDGCRGPAIINLSLHFNPTSAFHPNTTAIGIPLNPGDAHVTKH